MGQGSEVTDGEKDGGWIVDKQAVPHLLGSWFVLSHMKPFGICKFVQTCLCVGESSQIVSFITWIELEKETGNIILEAMVVASLAAL